MRSSFAGSRSFHARTAHIAVEEGRAEGTQHGTKQIDPVCGSKGACEDGRAKGTRRVERSAGKRPAKEDAKDDCETDHQAGQTLGVSGYGRMEDRRHQEEGQDGFDQQSLPGTNTCAKLCCAKSIFGAIENQEECP